MAATVEQRSGIGMKQSRRVDTLARPETLFPEE